MRPQRAGHVEARACGSWPSRIAAAAAAGAPDVSPWSGPMFELGTDGAAVYWLASRPTEAGRNALIRWHPDDEPGDLTPPLWDVRTRVFEYGGGAYTAAAGGVWFVHFADGRIYATDSHGRPPSHCTAAGPWRHADLVPDLARGRVIALREDFTAVPDRVREERVEIIAIDLRTRECTLLASGADFLSSPALSADGSTLAWVSWNHPHMPWDRTRLHRARFAANGLLGEVHTEATGAAEACMQPRFCPDGHLYYLSDADGWWNLYRWRAGSAVGERVTTLSAEIGAPAWFRGARHYGFLDAERAVVLYTECGYWRIATVRLADGAILDRSPRHAVLTSVAALSGRAFVVGMDTSGDGGLYEYAHGELALRVPAFRDATRNAGEAISRAVPVVVPLTPSTVTREDEVCHAWFYAPANARYTALPGERPPVIVQFHGGPTAASSCAYSLARQFWTSRGFALIDVNYRGSSGRGRAFRHRLYGAWGETDVEDAVECLRHAAALGLVDPERAAIMGASAGGYTTLAALAFHDAFTAGVNLFGVSDIATFAATTHKFERSYLRTLVGDWEADPQLLVRRSPLQRLDGIRAPLLTLQGSDDRVVPPSQSLQVMEAVRRKGLPCAYLEFDGEGHGFRRQETLVRVLEATLSFLTQVFRIEQPDSMTPLVLENFGAEGESMHTRGDAP